MRICDVAEKNRITQMPDMFKKALTKSGFFCFIHEDNLPSLNIIESMISLPVSLPLYLLWERWLIYKDLPFAGQNIILY